MITLHSAQIATAQSTHLPELWAHWKNGTKICCMINSTDIHCRILMKLNCTTVQVKDSGRPAAQPWYQSSTNDCVLSELRRTQSEDTEELAAGDGGWVGRGERSSMESSAP